MPALAMASGTSSSTLVPWASNWARTMLASTRLAACS
jgi:hypothetical protein